MKLKGTEIFTKNVKNSIIIGSIVSLLFIGLGIFTGWQLHKELRPCPVITRDTIKVTDPYWHHIADSLINLPPKERVKWLPQDTLYIPIDTLALLGDPFFADNEIDSLEVFKKLYSVYRYKWEKSDSIIVDGVKIPLIDVVLHTTVTQNMPIKYELDYKIRRPFETVINNIDNSITYNKYVQFGLSMPIYTYKPESTLNLQDLSLEGTYVFPKGSIGIGWQPNTSVINIRASVTLLKFKRIQ